VIILIVICGSIWGVFFGPDENPKPMDLKLVPADIADKTAQWGEGQYFVYHGERYVGRIYRYSGVIERWFWGLDFDPSGEPAYGDAPNRGEAMARFKAAYEAKS
jgi:hypothetical protein